MLALLKKRGPFRHRNLRLYTWFQVFFSARFYYPVLAILFLDLGLTLDQFVILNAVWAATIFLAEVPSGALADIIGRKRLIVTAAIFMVAEMAILLIAPVNAGWTLFTFCAVNRILSGLSEAAASGADQALAYDTLCEHDEEDSWDDALATTMRWQSGAMFLAVIIGAATYDPAFLNKALAAVGIATELTQQQTLRIPIALCLLQALATCLTALRFRDVAVQEEDRPALSEIWARTLRSAKWVFTTKAALVIVIGALVIDSVARNFATITSSYYRLVEVPEKYYGFIAAGMSILGLFVPKLARALARRYSVKTNYTIGAAWVLLCLIALVPAWPYYGIIPAILLMAALGYISFLVSRYLNEITASHQRATVLSVKGLLFNLGYGFMSLLFSLGVTLNRSARDEQGEALEDAAFLATLAWQPLAFLLFFAAFLVYARRHEPLS